MTSPLVEKKRGFSPIWILPLLALCIGSWLLYKGFRDAGIDITVRFHDAKGITAGKTPVMYKGLEAGIVKNISISPDLSGVDLKIEMQRNSKPYLVEDLKFWIETVTVQAGKVTGLDTLLGGNYIGIQPGTSSKPARHFVGLSERPPLPKSAPGLHLSLRSDALRSIQVGSGIYHKNILIGEVQEYTLQDDGSVLLGIHIIPKYESLVNTNTRFWNASGIKLSGGITDLKLNIESMATLIRGGVVMDTPEAAEEGAPVKNGHEFPLYEDFEAAEYGIPVTLQLTAGEGLHEGITRVMYRGMKVGVVQKISINHDANHTVTAHVLLDPRAASVLTQGTRFYLVKPDVSLKGIRNLNTLVEGVYISFVPGNGPHQDHFIVEEDSTTFQAPFGKTFVLLSDNPGSIEIGAPVYLKKFQIGEVTGFTLANDARKVHIGIIIYNQYSRYIRPKTLFWNISGVRMSGDLSGVTIDIESFMSVLKGGIAITNPPGGKGHSSQPADPGSSFTLYRNYQAAVDATPALQQSGLPIRLTANELGTLRVGSPVLHKQIRVGEITGYQLREKEEDVLIKAFIEKRYAPMLKSTSRFYSVSGVGLQADLNGVKLQTGSLESIVSGGIAFYTPEKDHRAKAGHLFTLYNDFEAAQNQDRIPVTLHFSENGGLKKGSAVKYQDLEIGAVSDVRFNRTMTGVTVNAVLDKAARDLLKEGTRFWLVRPALSLRDGVANLDTLVKGPHIAMAPGDGEYQGEFSAMNAEPVSPITSTGLNVVLESNDRYSISKGSPVYYRRVQVGGVTGVKLSPEFNKVLIYVHINAPYTPIIRENTKFWNISGVQVTGGIFSGIKMTTGSIESILAGGIALSTPDTDKMGEAATNGRNFILYQEAKDEWHSWKPVIKGR